MQSIIFLLVGLAFASGARASDTRDKLILEVEALVLDVGKSLNGLSAQSNAAGVDRSLSKLTEMKRALTELAKVKGDDPRAGKIVSTYDDHATKYVQVAASLKRIKERQYGLKPVLEKCEADATKLRSEIQRYLRANDSSGITALPELGRTLGEPIRKELVKAEGTKDFLVQNKSVIISFRPHDGNWPKMTDYLHDETGKILEHWAAEYKKLPLHCGELAKKDQHADIIAAVDQLEEAADTEIGKLRRAVAAWVKEARAIYRLDCEGMKSIWLAYCGNTDPGSEFEPAQKEADQIAAEMQRKVGGISDVLYRERDLRAWAAELQKKEETRDSATRILAQIKGEVTRLERIRTKGALLGASHPLVQFSNEYGKTEHSRLEGSYGCDVADQRFSVSSGIGRPDCIVFDRCEVLEFKPNNASAIAKGEEQLSRYVPAVNAFFQKYVDSASPPPLEYGGSWALQKIQKNCLSAAGDVRFVSGGVKTYDMCKQTYECVE